MEGFKEEKLRVQLQMAWPGDFQRGRLGFRSSSYLKTMLMYVDPFRRL